MILVILNFEEWCINWFEFSTSFFSVYFWTNRIDGYFIASIRFGSKQFKKRWGR